MKETQPQPSIMPLNEFLPALFQRLSKEGVHYCVLRGYDGFPDCNTGRDVDLLVRASDLSLAIQILRSILGVRVVGYFARPYVASVFLQGISTPPQASALQIDCDLSLTWKGLAYLPADTVLQNALLHPAGNSTFFVPSPVHEAITSLFASLLIGGFVKEKYFFHVQRTFVRQRAEVIAALLPQFGATVTTRLVDSVIAGDRENILGCVRPLRTSLVLRNLFRAPFHCALAVARHYAKEFEVRYLPGLLVTVCILSPESCDSTTVIETLMPILQFSAVKVENRSFWPDSSCKCDLSNNNEDSNRNCGPRQNSWASMATFGRWLVEEWLSRFQKNSALRLVESDSHNLMTNQRWRRYGIPQWFAWLAGKMLPSPDLWILLDPAVGEIQSGNRDLLCPRLLRQLDASRSFVKTKGRFVILDASKPSVQVAEDAYSAIIDFLARRADGLLKDRF
jgi:hypothetical protein